MKIFISSRAQRQLDKLPDKMFDVISSKFNRLANEPFGPQSKKLKDRDMWRYRIGDYRILYIVEKKNLIILSVAHRKEAYKIG
ncbi:MAG: type II toxin-antitoxin system RelE/ParE family toxin [Patescibacteria group bacterium]